MALGITNNDFFERLSDDILLETELFLSNEIEINQQIISWQHRLIKNVTFKEKVTIRDAEINSGLAFSNCTFEKGIVFHNVKSINYDSYYNQDNYSVSFTNCNAKYIVFEENCLMARSVIISENCEIEKVSINKLKIDNSGLVIKKSTISYLDIAHCISDINLSNSFFNEPLRIESLIGNISLIKNEFNDNVMFWNVECSFSLTLNYNFFKDNFNIEASRFKSISIIGDTFEKKAELENRDMTGSNLDAYLNKLYISEAKFIEGFDFNGLGKDIEEIKLPLTPTFEGLLKFEGWKADNIIISGVNQNLKLLFKRVSFRFFVINDFTNYSDISFDKCKGFGDCTFNLSDCDLGSTKFSEFEFDSFKEIRIDNATLDNIKLSSCSWFTDKSLSINGSKTEYKRKREIYRQLKQALKNNGNQIDSLLFQARELLAYKNELKNSKKYDLGDRIIMSVSWLNDYGLNWIRPVYIIFGITAFIYILLLPYLSDKISYSHAENLTDIKNTWNALYENSNVFWKLFNPIRKIEDTYTRDDSSWIYCLDLLHRIFLGIMIFQIIKAFRKHVSN